MVDLFTTFRAVLNYCSHSPTVKETLHSLTDTYRSLERAEEAAKLEKRETPSSEVGQGMPGETFTDRSSEQVGNNGPHASPKRKV